MVHMSKFSAFFGQNWIKNQRDTPIPKKWKKSWYTVRTLYRKKKPFFPQNNFYIVVRSPKNRLYEHRNFIKSIRKSKGNEQDVKKICKRYVTKMFGNACKIADTTFDVKLYFTNVKTRHMLDKQFYPQTYSVIQGNVKEGVEENNNTI